MRILIIDDDISAATTLKALLLSQESFEIDVSYAGREGLNMMIKNPLYDVLILDIMMPDFSGIDVCRAMNANEKLKNTPVMLASALPITSKELADLMAEFKALNVVKGVLEKPFIIEDMIREIHRIVDNK